MTSETKISLLIGLGMVLVIGIIVSDQLAVPDPENNAPLLRFVEPATDAEPPRASTPSPRVTRPAATTQNRQRPIPTPGEAEVVRAEQADILAPTPNAPALVIDGDPIEPPQTPVTRTYPATQPATETRERTTQQRILRIEPSPTQPAPLSHTVQAGETLSEIAERYYGSQARWRDIANANPDTVGSNGRIMPGSRLAIPNAEAPPTSTSSQTNPPQTDSAATVTVQPGDSLARIANRYLGSTDRWEEIYSLNRDQLSSPNRVMAGMTLKLPSEAISTRSTTTPSTAEKTHTVTAGDSLSRIAARHLGSTSRWNDVYQLNRDRIKDPDRLVVGTELRLPER
ncbi:LysM peptidoglycan-binding domain-containing protein [Mucisphaera sp.]|uniref:LysM peptidoglycan-binding domain-containing protein n=1 Tax=Mucisphaera sp. TaxID=2913024 RepID=UPI003D0AAEF7